MERRPLLKPFLRGMTERDIPLVTNAWLQNARKMWMVKGVPNNIYYHQHHKILEQILPRETTITIVACDPNDLDRIWGWLCCEVVDNVLVLHYCWVRDGFKARGRPEEHDFEPGCHVGQQMLEKLLDYEDDIRGIVHTHETITGARWLDHLYDNGVLPFRSHFNPYLLFTRLPTEWNHERVMITEEDNETADFGGTDNG